MANIPVDLNRDSLVAKVLQEQNDWWNSDRTCFRATLSRWGLFLYGLLRVTPSFSNQFSFLDNTIHTLGHEKLIIDVSTGWGDGPYSSMQECLKSKFDRRIIRVRSCSLATKESRFNSTGTFAMVFPMVYNSISYFYEFLFIFFPILFMNIFYEYKISYLLWCTMGSTNKSEDAQPSQSRNRLPESYVIWINFETLLFIIRCRLHGKSIIIFIRKFEKLTHQRYTPKTMLHCLWNKLTSSQHSTPTRATLQLEWHADSNDAPFIAETNASSIERVAEIFVSKFIRIKKIIIYNHT